MDILMVIAGTVHDEALRYVYALGDLSLLASVAGAVGFIATVAWAAVRGGPPARVRLPVTRR